MIYAKKMKGKMTFKKNMLTSSYKYFICKLGTKFKRLFLIQEISFLIWKIVGPRGQGLITIKFENYILRKHQITK